MDFKRFFTLIFLFLFTPVIFALPEPSEAENVGIVFIHGTNDHRDDAEGVYWKTDFIESMAQALPNPENYYVLRCDFSKYMWDEDAAGCTVNQLLKFIDEKNIDSLVLYTHSNGGNVMRWILSHPTYDPRYLRLSTKIKQIIALAPSSAGTPLADLLMNGGVFESSLTW
jgi:triacylglycerol esterase/lipase EstA (alpha/beta hydrolase family)